MSQHAAPSSLLEIEQQNIARDNAFVGAQFGVVHGNVDIYQELSGDATPPEKYGKGLEYLRGKIPRRAEELIDDAWHAGHRSVEVAYHWSLSILSGRSYDELSETDLAKLDTAIATARSAATDPWSAALRLISQIIECLATQDLRQNPDYPQLDAVRDAYQRLDADRRDELARHLDTLLAGPLQDQLDALEAANVEAQRMRDERQQRVRLFFEPNPTPPRPRIPTPPQPGSANWSRLVGGVLAVLVGGYLALRTIHDARRLAAEIFILLSCAVGGYLLARFGLVWAATIDRLNEKVKEYAGSATPRLTWAAANSRGPGSKKFSKGVQQLVDEAFEDHRPHARDQGTAWRNDTAVLREALRKDIIHTYGDADVAAETVGWAIRWRVRQIKERWADGTLYDFRDKLKVPRSTILYTLTGAAALATGVITALIVAFELDIVRAVVSATLLISGLILSWLGGSATYREHHRHNTQLAEYAAILEGEKVEYQKWLLSLTKRPDDFEMARWLDYDKSYLRTVALQEYGLANRDLISHLVLTEAGPGSRRARVLNGPPRYSQYVVLIFLLTEGGVRQVAVSLDFETGIVYFERRMTFRYDALAAAQVEQLGLRFHGGRSGRARIRKSHNIVLSQALRLTLVNGDTMKVLVENFSGEFVEDEREDRRRLVLQALDTSGVSGALRVLEAISAEGREWLNRERARSRRRRADTDRITTDWLSQEHKQRANGNGASPPKRASGPARNR